MTRRRKVLLGIAVGVAVGVGGIAWALPEIVRRAAMAQIPKAVHRAVSIEDVDLNLFTGRFAIKKLRLADREGPDAFVELERLEGRLSYLSLIRSTVRLTELTLTRPTVRLVRTGPRQFNFSDLIPEPDPKKKPSGWIISLDRLSLIDGAVALDDRALSPPRQWRIGGLTVGASALSTRPTESAGRITVGGRVNEAKLDLVAQSLGVGPGTPSLGLKVDDFDLTALVPYLPPDLPARLLGGKVSLVLTLAVERRGDAITRAKLTGDVRVDAVSLAQPDRPAPFLTLGRLSVGIKEADLLARAATLGSIEVDGLDLRVGRGPTGEIDLLTALKARSAQAAPPPTTATASTSAQRLRVQRLALGAGTVAFTDEAVSPRRDWRVEGLSVDGRDLSTWPEDGPGRLAARAMVGAGGGPPASVAVDAREVRLAPPSASVHASLKGFDLPLVRPYLPPGLPAVPTAGALEADLDAEVARGPAGLERAHATGDLRLAGLSFARADGAEAFARVARVETRVRRADLLGRAMTLGRVAVDGLDVRVRRTASGQLDVVPAAASGEAPPAAPATAAGRPLPFTARLERLTVRSSSVTVTDEAVTPARVWRVDGLTVDGGGFSSTSADSPGQLHLRAQLNAEGSSGKPASLTVDADSVKLLPLAASARVALEDFDLAVLGPYWPPALPASLQQGSVGVSLNVSVEQGESGLRRAVASGRARLDGLVALQRGGPAPFVKLPKLTAELKQADLLARAVTLGSVEIEGLDLRATRDAQGRIDLLALTQAPAAPRPAVASPGTPAVGKAAAPTSGAPVKAAPGWRLKLERLGLAHGTASFEDHAVSPTATLAVTDLMMTVTNVTWPVAGPAKLELTAGLPGGGLFMVLGTAVIDPLDVTVAISTLDAPIGPYGAYIPFPGRLAGLFSGDSLSTVKVENGKIIAASLGNGWIKSFEIQDPEGGAPPVLIERAEIRGIDFAWPTYAFVDKVTITRPEVRVEREPDGDFEIRRLLRPASAAAPAPSSPVPAPSGAAPASEEKRPGLIETMVLDFKDITIEEGYARFLDRTFTPPFSQDMTHLAVTIRNVSNAPGRRATLTAHAIVGGDAVVDLRGELSRLGDDLFADLVGELRDFSLASVSPYTNSFLSWAVQRGKLGAKVHYRIEQDRVTVDNEIRISNFAVAPAGTADEVKRRIGLPLGLIVGLLKDSRGDITLDLPVTGNWKDRSFDWGEAVWSAVKQVVVKVLAAPFRAIGRLFTGGGGGEEKIEALAVDPVTFSPGSSVLGPAAEGHLRRVADFLREKPALKLALAPVATSRDVDVIKGQEVTARIQRLQREKGIADFPVAVRTYFEQQAPAVTPPKSADEQLALLRQREPVPQPRVEELLGRRLEATRETLVKTEGIAPERLLPAPPKPLLEGAGEGRVEFAISAE